MVLQKTEQIKNSFDKGSIFKVETTDQILVDNTRNNCKETDNLKGELGHLRSMYDDLLEEQRSKPSKLIIQQNNEKEFADTISCKHCSFQILG